MQIAANMLLIVLMMVMLLAGLILWFVLVLRKIAILVVVAFAPLLIAGYLWAPTRAWVRRATEVLIALVFTKTAIFATLRDRPRTPGSWDGAEPERLRGHRRPALRRLLHAAADAPTGALRRRHPPRRRHDGHPQSGAAPVTSRIPQLHHGDGRHAMARAPTSHHTSNSAGPQPATTLSPRVTPWEGTPSASGVGPAGGPSTAVPAAGAGGATGAAGASGVAGAGAKTPAAGGGAAAGAASAVGAVATTVVATGQKAADVAQKSANHLAEVTTRGSNDAGGRPRGQRPTEDKAEPPLPGPPGPEADGPALPSPDGGQQ